MAAKYLKFQNRVLLLLAAVLGVNLLGSCEKMYGCPEGCNNITPMYGCPAYDFRVDGKVTNARGEGVEGVQVRFGGAEGRTDAEGRYVVREIVAEGDSLFFSDTDGAEHGAYKDKAVAVKPDDATVDSNYVYHLTVDTELEER